MNTWWYEGYLMKEEMDEVVMALGLDVRDELFYFSNDGEEQFKYEQLLAEDRGWA